MVKKVRKLGTDVPVRDIRHSESRVNLPTPQLAEYMPEATRAPQEVRWPRDISLDPQLVWKGKDISADELVTQSAPLYVQEKILPEAIIRDLHGHADASADTAQLDLFGSSEKLSLEQKVEFYKHSEEWSNRLILGDSLLVMTSLVEREQLRGKVQMVYMDPPYGIKFGSNWQVSTRSRDVKDGQRSDLTPQPEQVRAYRDTWELGVHSYLSYLRDRIAVSRELLNETGSMFVQIGFENVHLVRSLMDEVFGPANCMRQISMAKTSGLGTSALPITQDYLLWYAKDIDRVKTRRLYLDKFNATDEHSAYRHKDDGGLYRLDNLSGPYSGTESCLYEYEFEGRKYSPPRNRQWKTTKRGMDRLVTAKRIIAAGNTISYKRYLDDFPITTLTDAWSDTATGGFAEDRVYVVQSSLKAVSRAVLLSTDPGDLVIDPTIGSGTTAIAAEQWGRRWIGVDTSRVALSIARTRIMGAKFPYYLLADSPEGKKKELEISGREVPGPSEQDVRRGFVLERVPHIMLGSIANAEQLREGMSASDLSREILRSSELEYLHDRPYEDKKIVRVSGPLSVESLSPHRQLADEQGEKVDALGESGPDAAEYAENVREQLRASGVKYNRKDLHIRFETLDPYPGGQFVHALGSPRDLPQIRRIAISIGPRYGTVTRSMVLEASKEAASTGSDLLIVCGFAFESDAQNIPNLGKIEVVCARMNSDLLVQGLKATGAGQLFMVFGEPDVKVAVTKDEKVSVEIMGIDVFDPASGSIRSDSTDEIAAWFIDTNYNGECFFVRQAYFIGKENPYEKLRSALRDEIDPEVWESINSPKSRLFQKPTTGKIAIKVINHFGDEVMKVYPVI